MAPPGKRPFPRSDHFEQAVLLPGCLQLQPPGNGIIPFLVDQGASGAHRNAGGTTIVVQRSDTAPIAVHDGNILFLSWGLDHLDPGLLDAEHTIGQRRTERLAEPTPVAKIFNDIDALHTNLPSDPVHICSLFILHCWSLFTGL